MSQSLVRCLMLCAGCGLLAAWPTFAGETGSDKSPEQRRSDEPTVREYTKEWRDDYRGYHKDVYFAYIKNLKDEDGSEVQAEIWHGPAHGLHPNGSKAWDAGYRHGKREGEFSTWSEEGVRTGLMFFEQGLLQGKSTQWSADGRKMREETYDQDRQNGESRWWDGDGKLVSTGTYQDGLPWTGTFVDFDRSFGKTRSVIARYEHGKKVSQEAHPGKWWW